MTKVVKTLFVFLCVSGLAIYFNWGDWRGRFVDYTAFKHAVISKNIQNIYITDNKVWFVESINVGGKAKKVKTVTMIEDRLLGYDLLDVIKQYAITAHTDLSFATRYADFIRGFTALIIGVLLILFLAHKALI